MTKKDFIVIAEAIKSLPSEIRHEVALRFSNRLKAKYHNFDPIRFRDYIEGE